MDSRTPGTCRILLPLSFFPEVGPKEFYIGNISIFNLSFRQSVRFHC